MKTIIIIILDESSSMSAKKSEVLEGFNNLIESQKEVEEDEARLYLVKFNSDISVVHRGIKLEDVPELTTHNYTPGRYTALYDAIAEGVRIADNDKRADERVICAIMTDGEENSSRRTTLQQVKEIITGHEARGDWTFLYIGENPEKWTKDTGMSRLHGINYSHENPRACMTATDAALSKFRGSEESYGTDLYCSESSR